MDDQAFVREFWSGRFVAVERRGGRGGRPTQSRIVRELFTGKKVAITGWCQTDAKAWEMAARKAKKQQKGVANG